MKVDDTVMVAINRFHELANLFLAEDYPAGHQPVLELFGCHHAALVEIELLEKVFECFFPLCHVD